MTTLDFAFALVGAELAHLAAGGGPDLRPNAHVKSVAEAQEFAADPSLAEAADLLICVAAKAAHEGWTTADLARAVADKAVILRVREWRSQPDGTFQHMREEATS